MSIAYSYLLEDNTRVKEADAKRVFSVFRHVYLNLSGRIAVQNVSSPLGREVVRMD